MMQTDSTAINNWNFFQKLFLRFFTVYFLIQILPFPLFYIPYLNTIDSWYRKALAAFVSFTGKSVFHIPFQLAPTSNGSGDTTYYFVRLFLYMVGAVIATLVWTIADRRRKSYYLPAFRPMDYIRCYLGFTMMEYGFEKILKMQFPFPYFSLYETYGQSSPLALLWNFMGYSTVFNLFTGLAEAGAGFLLLFRKWATFGALLSIVVLSNVVLLNLIYDVSVKLFSINLLLMTFYVIAPQIKRLADFFFLNKAVQPVPIQPTVLQPRIKPVWVAIKLVLTVYIIYSLAANTWRRYNLTGDGAFSKTPLFGIYHVEKFVNLNDSLPSSASDPSKWKVLSLVFPRYARIQTMNDTIKEYHVITDTAHKKIQFYSDDDAAHKSLLTYTVPDSVHLILQGKFKNDSLYMVMQKQDIQKLELMKRKFHWINESPYKK